MHRRGLNLRHVGFIRAHSQSTLVKQLLLVEMIARGSKNLAREWLRSFSHTPTTAATATNAHAAVAEKLENSLNSTSFWSRDIKAVISSTYDDVALTSAERDEEWDLRNSVGDLTLLWSRLQKVLVGATVTVSEEKRVKIQWNEEGKCYVVVCLVPLIVIFFSVFSLFWFCCVAWLLPCLFFPFRFWKIQRVFAWSIFRSFSLRKACHCNTWQVSMFLLSYCLSCRLLFSSPSIYLSSHLTLRIPASGASNVPNIWDEHQYIEKFHGKEIRNFWQAEHTLQGLYYVSCLQTSSHFSPFVLLCSPSPSTPSQSSPLTSPISNFLFYR